MRVTSLPLAVFSLAAAASASAQEGPRFIEDDGHIAVFEHDGSSYDKNDGGGGVNSGPRRALLQEFIATHGDFYDFVAIFTNFEFDRGGAKGFYLGVRNDVAGIGDSVFDHGASFGSAKRLQGVIDMGPLAQYREDGFSLELAEPGFRHTLGILAHEVGHRWLARVRYLDGSELRTDLLGRDLSHWSYLLSSEASFLYGSQWEAIGGGAYRASEVQTRFSSLDLYLMGFARPEEVAPLRLLRNPEVDATRIPELGAVTSATEEVIAFDRILAAEGARQPSSSSSQKDFRLAFVFLSEKDLVPSPLDLQAVDRVRRAFVGSFFSLTRGRAFIDTDLLNVVPPLPATIPDTALALDWLLSAQKEDGRFEDHPRTSLRDTTAALETLALLGIGGEAETGAFAWLSSQPLSNVDALSRAIAAGRPLAVDPLLQARNADGGWGVARGYRSDALDTALALEALSRTGASEEVLRPGRDRLIELQSPSGGWSSIAGTPPDLLATCASARALPNGEALQNALAWLAASQELDGGFGDGPSTPYATACAAEALLAGEAPSSSIDRALDYLRKTQRPDGSWEASAFQTASVLRALVPASSANLSLRTSDMAVDPDPPEVGETVSIEVTVRNRARVPASAFVLELFDGDPELGGIAIGAVPLSPLAPGGSSTASFSWNTAGLEGAHRLFAIADLAGAVPELNKTDNVAARDVEVLPLLPNLALESLVSLPASPAEGAAATLTARVASTGSLPAGASVLRLFEGHPSLGVVVGELAIPPLAKDEAFSAVFEWTTAGKVGRRRLVAVADPEKELRERFEGDNEISLDVDVRPPPPPEPDLLVEKSGLTLSPNRLTVLPQDVTLTAFVRNTGANPVASTLVELYQGGILLEGRSIAVPGDGGVETSFILSVASGGSRTYTVRLDGGNEVAERNEANNEASIDLVDPMDTIDVALSALALSAPSLTAGEVLHVDFDVQNRGTRRLSAAAVSLFAASSLASTASLDLAPGEIRRVSLTWKANRLGSVPLEVRADPDGRLSELDEENNLLAASVDVAGNGLPNLAASASEIEVTPLPPLEGEGAAISARVRNLGEEDAQGFEVSFFGGDPEENSIPLGSAALSSLAAGADALVSVSWNEVNLRGTTLLFVVVDPAEAVEELDESDNRAFKVLDITGLADLGMSTAALRLDPPFARSGDAVTIEAAFENFGETEVLDVTAEVRLDDPESGALLGSETFPLLVPGEVASFAAIWDTTGVEGEHTLFLVLDVLEQVREQREDNNRTAVPVALQDGDLFVTPLYFSPDGNGVQDEAAFFYRVAGGPVSVHVAGEKGGIVRALGGGGSAVWDGRTDRGVLAMDGEYFFVVESDGVELARRRVVLDTNRSSVAEALGSEFVGFANLTCPLGGFFPSVPAFLPDDSAAFFIAREEGEAGYPAGLYRASADGSLLEPIATGVEFESLEFMGRPFPSQAERIVSPDGARALASKDSELHLLDLATGATTALGRFESDARWSPDGSKLLVSDFDGIDLYSPSGEFLTQLSPLGAEVAEWSPDGLLILYRPWAETALHVMNADGSNDRAVPGTDATDLFSDVSLADGATVDKILWTRGGEAFAFRWVNHSAEQITEPFEIDLSTGTRSLLPAFEEVSSGQEWAIELSGFTSIRRFRGRERRNAVPGSGGSDLHWSYRDTYLSYQASPEEGCIGFNRYLVRSLLNGEARLRLSALPSGFGVRVSGTVADRNLDRYRLEYAPAASPLALVPIQAPSSTPVVEDTLTTWLPPAPGDYLVRLTLRDRAGNEVVRLERVSWARTLPIAGLRRAPRAISPNGDGVQDEVLIQYNVLEPVNLVFRVRDSQGDVVRTIARDESGLGAASFVWDGTGDGGSRVEDGRYVIEVAGAELPVLVDATPPDVEAQFSDLYTARSGLGVDLEGFVEDENLEEWILLPPEGDPLISSVREVGSESLPEILVEGGSRMRGLEIRGRDVAGNVTSVPLAGPASEVRVVARHFRGEDVPLGPFEPGAAEPVPIESVLPGGRFGWNAEASFPASDLRFVYREEGSGEEVEFPTKGKVRFSASDFPIGRSFTGRFEAEGISSQEVSFTIGPDAIFVDPPRALDPFVHLVHTLGEELVEGTIFLVVGNEKTVFQTYRPVPRFDRLSPPRSPCGAVVSLFMEAIGESGRSYRSTTTLSYRKPAAARVVIPGCSGVLDAGVSDQSSPEAEAPGRASAMVYQNLDPAPDAVTVLLTEGADTREVARLEPDRTVLDASFEIGDLPEGFYRLATGDGDFEVAFHLDQSAPEASILLPVEGGNACVVSEDDAEWVALEVSGRDESVTGFHVEVMSPSGTWDRLPTKGGADAFPAPFFQRSLLARIPAGLEGQQSFRLVVSSARLVNEAGGNSVFPALPQISNNGSLLGTAVRNLVIVRSPALAAIEAAPRHFSPLLGAARVRGELREGASLTVRVHRTSGPSPGVVRTLMDGESFGVGTFEVPWDGLDDLGGPVEDGEYRVEVLAVNGCGATSRRETLVTLDATAPSVEIADPAPSGLVSIAVEVIGTATDENLESYRLEFGQGPSPSVFEPIGPPLATGVENARLGTWSAGDLAPGLYTLRLSASDVAGNESSTSVLVDVVSPDLVARFEANPSILSPNADGVKDASEISFRLKRDSVVTLAIRRPDDSIAATLISAESRASGDHSVSWDGAVPDGSYEAHLLAQDASLPSLQEEASLSLIADSSAPSIEVTAPASFVSLPSAIQGSIQDENLERYQIDVGPEGGALARLAEDGAPSSGVLASLVGLADGPHKLSIRASDLAGNTAVLDRSFGVDSTAPAVEIRDLPSHVSTRGEPLSVKARVVEEHLESYALEVGAGASPSVFVALASGSSLASPDFDVSWDVSVLPDGMYTFRLRAADEAGSVSEVLRPVDLDGTPPSIAIEAPAEGAFASRDTAVVGSAGDESFSEAVLRIARGDSPFQELARFDAPILDAVLKDGLPFEDGTYRLSLAAKDLAGNTSAVERTFHIDSVPPAAPEGLQARIEDRASVRLAWQASVESDASGYAVYRDGVLLTEASVTEILDGPLSEGRYVYTVAALDRGGLESERSQPAEARIDLTPPDVALRSPDEGARVRGLVDVVGTAFSEFDFREYRLSAAPGGTPSSPALLKKSPLPVNFATLFQWEAIALEGTFILTLEAEDRSGNVAADSIRVFVDNGAPDPPVLASVTGGTSPEDVLVVWEGSAAAGVSGYLVFRNDEVANAPGVVSGDLRPFLVPGPSYEDTGLPDGRFCYRIAAMDEAGNLSADSNELCIFLDNRAPRAILVEPENGARFDSARTLRAVAEDEDVDTVLFQFQETGASVWTDIGSDGELPFEVLWDLTGLSFGSYRVRAVATDAGGRTDPDPAFIEVVLADSTPPEVPASFLARVDGDTVTLTWEAVTAPDLSGYRLYRDGALLRTLGAVTSSIEAGTADGRYEYRVSAIDAESNESAKSAPAEARVYRPVLSPPFPVFEADTVEVPGEAVTPEARVELLSQGTSSVVAEVTAGLDGRFVFTGLALPFAESFLEARAIDLEGNRSRLSEVVVLVRNEPPATPTGLAGVANGSEASLSWAANGESDLSGYVVKRGSETVTPDGGIRSGGPVPATLTASASSSSGIRQPQLAVDGDLFTHWASQPSSSFVPTWLDVRLAPARHVREVRVFLQFPLARDFRILGEISGRLAPLAVVRGNTELSRSFVFPFAIRTERIRIEVTALAADFATFTAIAEVELYGPGPLTGTGTADTPDASGIYTYGVSAVDVYGGASAPSELELAVGDVTPPEPPAGLTASVLLADISLSWAPSSSTDVAAYRVYRDGAPLGAVSGVSFQDPLLPDGLYRYQVAAVDGDGNESAKSNDAEAEVSVDPPAAPSLSVEVVPEGRALSLAWTSSSGPLGILEYAIFRSTSSGGPYVEVSRSPGLGIVDGDLSNGVPYFYVVRALDPRGEASFDSNEASGTPSDGAAPDAPVLLQPTTAGSPIALTTAATDVSGRAEPSSRVRVFRGTDLVAEVDAASTLVEARSFPVSGNGVRATDGMRLADVGPRGVRLRDFTSGTSRDAAFDAGGEDVHGAAFSPDGGRLAIAAGSSLHVLDLDSGAAASFALGGESGAPEWVSESSVAVVVERNVVLLDVSSGAAEEIYQGSFFDPPRDLRLSLEGSRLAFLQGGFLFFLDLTSRSSVLAAEATGFTWTSDSEVVLADFDGLHLRDAALGTSVPIAGAEGMRFPARLGPGEIIALSAENEVVLVGTGISALGPIPASDFDVELFTATGDFRVLLVDRVASRAELFSLPGRFEARGVALASGPNEITALAEDAGGNASPLSAPIEIVFDDALLPDLVLADLLVVPVVPASGDVASLSVTVRNDGLSEAPASFVQLALGDGLGNRSFIGSVALPAIAAGGSVDVARGWDTSGLSGAFHLFAEADPLGTVDERDEANNSLSKATTVVAERGIGLSIAAALPSYSPREDVEIRVEAVNGGQSSSGVALETVIEDGIGSRVATVDERTVPLRFGDKTAYTVFWNAGGSLAGTYRARVLASGGSAADDFEVRRVLDVRASVASSRPAYVQGGSAAFLAELTDEGSNAPLRGLTLHFEVGSEFEATSTVSYLPMGASTEVGVVWPRIGGPPGPRTVTLRVLEGAQEIATATGSFEVRPATEVELSGVLVLESSEVPAGGPIAARFEIENRGILPAAGVSARLELFDPATGLSSLLEQVAFDLAPGEVFTGEVLLDTNGLGLGPRSVTLAAPSPLASAPVTLFAVPEPPSVNDPAEGTSAEQPLRLSVNNATNPNGERLTYEFEIYLDPSLRFLLGASTGIPEGANTTAWGVPLELQENERYFWRARARDRFATSGFTAPASFFADTVNDAPSAPSLSSPAPSTEVSSRTPALSVVNALDPEGEALTYTFEVFTPFDPGEPIFSAEAVPEGDGETSVVVAALLDEDETYFWRARASDSELDSDWTAAASFRVNTGNQPPAKPEAIRPRDEDAGTLLPELAARAGFDPEGEAVLHRFEIDSSPSFDSPALQIADDLAPAGDEVRWTPPSPLLENEVYFWRARATDGLSASDWSETVSFRVDTANESPSVPRAEGPVGGALVESATPTLVLVNAADPEADRLVYDFEVYEADSLVVKVESLREGEGRTAWTVSPRLEEDRTYRYRARAKDGALASEWSSFESFLVNAVNGAPSAPSLGAPSEGGVVSSLPVTLEVVNAADIDGDALTYRFEVYEDPDLTVLVEASGGVLESLGRTSWQMTAALEENHPYYWRARASDGSLEGAWMPTARFRFSLENEAPAPPALVSPAEGETVAEPRPVFTIENASDPDGDLVRYVFEIRTESGVLVLRSPEVEAGDPRTSWQIPQDLAENETFLWRALSTDGVLETASADTFAFVVNALDEPPLPPTPLAPANGSTIASRAPVLFVQNSTSPDGRPLRYEFEIFLAGGALVASEADVAEGPAQTSWEVPLELEPGLTYSWRARAGDDRGLLSDWSESFTFAVEPSTSDCLPEWREDFESSPGGFRLRRGIAFPRFEVDSGKLESRFLGRGAFLFEGTGESRSWRNYELRGELALDDDPPAPSFCGFRAGVVFYSGSEGEYRLDVSGPGCKSPRARLVKSVGHGPLVLDEREIDEGLEALRFRIEVVNGAASTEIHAELEAGDRIWVLEAVDSNQPLRGGTVGAWSSFVKASWDDFHVRELSGFESGISGDADGDGVCDEDAPPELHDE